MGLALMLCVSFRTRVSIVVVSVTLPPLVRIAGMVTLEIYEYINDTIDNILSFLCTQLRIYLRHGESHIHHSLFKPIFSLFPAWTFSQSSYDIVKVTSCNIV